MIEIVCPSCQARYELPDNSIGPQGRKVSCSSCQHKWRAFPEGMEPAEPAHASSSPSVPDAAEPEPAGVAMSAAPSQPVAAASGPSAGVSGEPPAGDAPASFSQPPVATGSRDDQLAAIRRMLSDLKESADSVPKSERAAESEPEPEPEVAEAAAAAVAPAARGFYREGKADEPQDSLKARITQVDNLGRAVKGEPSQSGYDAAQLRKRHEKRAKRMQRARERRRKSGGFLTGFTLVAVVASVVVGLYVLHPQIIASQPQLEPAMNQYVVTIDRYRVELGEQTEVWKSWISEKVATASEGGETEQKQ